MEKIIVDKNKCIGCGACVGLANDIFEFGDDGLAQVIENTDFNSLSEETKSDIEYAIDGCPTSAIEKK